MGSLLDLPPRRFDIDPVAFFDRMLPGRVGMEFDNRIGMEFAEPRNHAVLGMEKDRSARAGNENVRVLGEHIGAAYGTLRDFFIGREWIVAQVSQDGGREFDLPRWCGKAFLLVLFV